MRAAQAEAFNPKPPGSLVRVAAGTGVLPRKEPGEKGRSLEHDPLLSFVSQSICITFPETFPTVKGRGPVSSSDAFYSVLGTILGLVLVPISWSPPRRMQSLPIFP